jgi:hypothetical protein
LNNVGMVIGDIGVIVDSEGHVVRSR